MENQLEIIVRESQLDKTKSDYILENFTSYFQLAAEWERRSKDIVVTDESQKEVMALARVGRLALREKRINLENSRKRLKEQCIREGKAIDGIANVLKALIVPIEEHLDKQENFVKYKQEAEEEAARIAEEQKAIEEQARKEREEAEERERIKKENEALRQKAIELEREKAKAEAERKAAEDKARAEAEAVRAANAKREAELKAKAEAEKKAAEDKAKADAEAVRIANDKRVAELKAKAVAETVALEAKAKLEAEVARIANAKREAELKAKAEAERKAAEKALMEKQELEAKLGSIKCPKCGNVFHVEKQGNQS